MKIFYLNDTLVEQSVYVNDLNSMPIKLKGRSGQIFEVEDRPNTIPFIKLWHSNQVLISTADFTVEKSD